MAGALEKRTEREPVRRSVEQKTSGYGPRALAQLLEHLGSPDLAWPLVHVAGTNGKGTVSVAVAALLAASGLRVGLFTSPHLKTRRERFRILDGRNDSASDLRQALGGDFPAEYGCLWHPSQDLKGAAEQLAFDEAVDRLPFDEYWPKEDKLAELAACVQRVAKTLPRSDQLTYFEEMTVLACLWFKEAACDYCVFEVGLGGGLDATNALRSAKVAVITAIGRDHEQLLGHDIGQIARAKAGIINANTGAVFLYPPALLKESAEDREKVRAAVAREAKQHGLKLTVPDLAPGAGQVDFGCLNHRFGESIFCAMREHLGQNETADQGRRIRFLSREERRALLQNLRWAGRLSLLNQNPLILFDGAHNPSAMQALTDYIKHRFLAVATENPAADEAPLPGPGGRDYLAPVDGLPAQLHFVIGFMADKDWEGMLQQIGRLAVSFQLNLYCVTAPGVRALPAEALADACRRLFRSGRNGYNNLDIMSCDSIRQAIASATAKMQEKSAAAIFICGSLYMFEEALAAVTECFGEDSLGLG